MSEVSLHNPFPASQVPAWDMETDVAVNGFGATGACAAIEAAAAGAKVMLFERNSGSGGASGLSGGEIYIGGGGGTDAQRAAGFEDSTEDFTAYLKMAGGPCVDEAKCDLMPPKRSTICLAEGARRALSRQLPARQTYRADRRFDADLVWQRGGRALLP
jgi:glycine/D-amino acid oxidase-like deaminating enzyme